jgi:hypothetical protein
MALYTVRSERLFCERLDFLFRWFLDLEVDEAGFDHSTFSLTRGPLTPPDNPGNPTVNFDGQRRSNVTHQSTTDPQARVAKKGAVKEAKLCFSAHALMENRSTILSFSGRTGRWLCRAARRDRDGR